MAQITMSLLSEYLKIRDCFRQSTPTNGFEQLLMDSDHSQDDVPKSGRKRKWNQKSWAKTKRKDTLNSGSGKIASIDCGHPPNSTVCQAHRLTEGDLLFLHSLRRRRARNDDPKSRNFVAKYTIPLSGSVEKLKVCARSFQSILCVSKMRVNRVVTYAMTFSLMGNDSEAVFHRIPTALDLSRFGNESLMDLSRFGNE